MPSDSPVSNLEAQSPAKPTDTVRLGEGDIARHVDSLRSVLGELFPTSLIRPTSALDVATERSVDQQSGLVVRFGIEVDGVPFGVVVRRPVPALDDPYEADAPRVGHMVDLLAADTTTRTATNNVLLRTYVDLDGRAMPYKIVTEVAKMVTIFDPRPAGDVLVEQRELHTTLS